MSNEDFKARGFLADMSQWRGNVHKVYPETFVIAYRMNDMGMRMLWELPAGQQNPTDEQAWAVTGYARAIEAFQASIVMVEHGAMAEARALARLCAENVIVTASMLKVEGMLELLVEDDAKHRLKLSNRMIEINHNNPDQQVVARYVQERDAIRAEYQDPRPRGLRIDGLAGQTGLKMLYELAYRLPSGNGAHATLGALRRHMVEDADGRPQGYNYNPDASDLRATMLAANAGMIHLIGLAVDSMGMKGYEPESRDLVHHWMVTKRELEAPG